MESADKGLEQAKSIERVQVLDWLISNLETAHRKVADVLTAGSVYNESIYQSIYNKLEEWIKLKEGIKDDVQSELYLPDEDREELAPELLGELSEKQKRIKEIRNSFTDDEIIVLQTLMNDEYASKED